MSIIFEPIDLERFKSIRDDELEIFKQLKISEIFKIDEEGDIVFRDRDENRDPIVIGILEPEPISIPDSNRFSIINGLNNTIKCDIYNGFDDVYNLDISHFKMLESGFNICGYIQEKDSRFQIYALFNENEYSGAVWIYNNSEYLAIYGIRTSLVGFLLGKRGAATSMLKNIYGLAKSLKVKKILVPWPLETMTPLLKKFGFIEFENIKVLNRERQFLSFLTSTTNYWELEINT